MAVKLTCPDCSATLKLSQPVPAGRKIKCPKCGNSFRPPEEEEAPKPAKPAKPAKPPTDDDDESGSAYSLGDEHEAKGEKDKKSVFDQPVRDRFPKSKRGPAQAAVIPPSNGLMAAGLLTGIFYLGYMVAVVWLVIFGNESMTVGRWLDLARGAFSFAAGAIITVGATKMQNLESYGWAVGGSIAAILPLTAAAWPWTTWPLTLPMGLWCVFTLRKPEVRAGYRVMKRPRKETTE